MGWGVWLGVLVMGAVPPWWVDTVRVVGVVVVMLCVFSMHFVRHPVGLRHRIKMDFIFPQVMHFPLSK